MTPLWSADWLDMEWLDATPADCPGWLDRSHIPDAGIYCSASRVGEVLGPCNGRAYRLWVAEYGPPTYAHIPTLQELAVKYGFSLVGIDPLPDVVACQWADPARGSGGDYDISACNF